MMRTRGNETFLGHGDLNAAPTHFGNGYQSRGNLIVTASVTHLGNSCVPEDLCARQISINQITI